MAQLVERVLGKDEVSSSNLDSSSNKKYRSNRNGIFYFQFVNRFELLIFAAQK